MSDHDRGDHRDRTDQAREQAIATFLYLGERLKGYYDSDDRTASERADLPPDGANALLRAIQGEIIPRLLLAHRGEERDAARPVDAPELTPEDHERFLALVRHDSAASTRRFVDQLLRRGVSEEHIFLDLLARAARRLGELWEQDVCTFSEVTIGLCRLHQVLRDQSVLGSSEALATPGDAPRVLLATACADQHVFGLVMVAEFFRRARWHVWSEPGASRSQLAAILAEQEFDLLGLSAACDAFAADIGSEIEEFRKASLNTELKVLVGGRLFVDAPHLVTRIGADGAADDAESAPAVAGALLTGQRARL